VSFGSPQATKGVTETYDALEKVFSQLQGFLARLDIYLESPSTLSAALKNIFVRTLAKVLEVLGLFTKYLDKNVGKPMKRTFDRIIRRTSTLPLLFSTVVTDTSRRRLRGHSLWKPGSSDGAVRARQPYERRELDDRGSNTRYYPDDPSASECVLVSWDTILQVLKQCFS
jgi:hypothetical protein